MRGKLHAISAVRPRPAQFEPAKSTASLHSHGGLPVALACYEGSCGHQVPFQSSLPWAAWHNSCNRDTTPSHLQVGTLCAAVRGNVSPQGVKRMEGWCLCVIHALQRTAQ